MLRSILTTLLISCFYCTPVFAQPKEISKPVVEIANEVILDIYNDILRLKAKYKELKDFGEKSLLVNKYGIYMINYSYSEVDKTLGEIPYAFGLTVVPTDEAIFQSAQKYAFDLGFPLLDLKFSGYQIINFKSKQYDINMALRKFGTKLWDYQQNFIPLKLSLKATKETFKVDEDITFSVSLTNDSNQNWRIKNLGVDTLYFIYDNKVWGAYEFGKNPKDEDGSEQSLEDILEGAYEPEQNPEDKEIILKAHQTMTKQFRGGGFPNPRALEIHCTYNLPFKGIKPTSSLNLLVVE